CKCGRRTMASACAGAWWGAPSCGFGRTCAIAVQSCSINIYRGSSTNGGNKLPPRSSEMARARSGSRAFSEQLPIAAHGIGFGSRGATPIRSDAMTATHSPRRRDRRQAFGDLLGALARSIDRRHDISLIRGTFEEMLRRMVPVRAVQLREAGSRWLALTVGATGRGAESVALEVPGIEPGLHGQLEAIFDPACGLGEWDFQVLGVAAHLGALVLEIERSRLQLSRSGLYPAVRPRRDGAAPLIGSTPVMQALRATIERVAATDFTILLEGESGVGKELVARQIHDLSRRRNGPFVAINCAALVETLLEAELFGIEDRTATGVRGRRGKFEAADGGTLFLDEVSDLSVSAQAKLLRAIQDLAVERVGGNGAHRVDIRVIAASNRSLGEMVERKLFRPDLFYRLSGVDVRVPTLREPLRQSRRRTVPRERARCLPRARHQLSHAPGLLEARGRRNRPEGFASGHRNTRTRWDRNGGRRRPPHGHDAAALRRTIC